MKPLLLALDTTHEFGSVALLAGGEVMEEALLHSAEGFGHILYQQIGALLSRHAAGVDDVVCFAAAAGPGSFTGVRVGLTCVKALAEATSRPAVAVSNLEALAGFGSALLRAVVLDARRGEIYGAVYDAAGNVLAPETVEKFPKWLESLPAGVEFISTDFGPFVSAIAGSRLAGAKLTTAPRALAAAVGRIAWQRYRACAAQDPAAVDANYVRRADAEMAR